MRPLPRKTLHLTAAALALWASGPGSGAAPLAAQEPAEARRLGLDDAIDRALRLNEDVLVARAEAARAEGIVQDVRSDALPQVTADFGYTRNIQTPVLFFNTDEGIQQISIGEDNEYAFALTFSQTLFDFSLGAARNAARLSRVAAADLVEASRVQVALSVRTAYYDALLSETLVGVQRQAVEQAERRLEQVEDFYEAGTASEFELLTAQVEVDNLRPALIEARNRLALERNRLKRRIHVPLDRELVLTDSFPEPEPSRDRDVYVSRALTRRPDLQAQRVRVDLQKENLTSKKMDAVPSLELNAAFLRRASSDQVIPPEEDFSQTTTAGLSFSLPLFDGRSRSAQVQQATAERDREQYRLRRLEENVRLEVQQARQAMEAARERIRASEANVARAERALEIALTRFGNGLSTQVEMNDAELAVTEARTNHARALHAYAVARARLLAATGSR